MNFAFNKKINFLSLFVLFCFSISITDVTNKQKSYCFVKKNGCIMLI